MSDPLHGCPSWACNTSLPGSYGIMNLGAFSADMQEMIMLRYICRIRFAVVRVVRTTRRVPCHGAQHHPPILRDIRSLMPRGMAVGTCDQELENLCTHSCGNRVLRMQSAASQNAEAHLNVYSIRRFMNDPTHTSPYSTQSERQSHPLRDDFCNNPSQLVQRLSRSHPSTPLWIGSCR